MQSMTDEGTAGCMRQRADQHRTLQTANCGRARCHNARRWRRTDHPSKPLLLRSKTCTSLAPRYSSRGCAPAHVRASSANASLRAATCKLAKTLHAIKPEKALLHNVF